MANLALGGHATIQPLKSEFGQHGTTIPTARCVTSKKYVGGIGTLGRNLAVSGHDNPWGLWEIRRLYACRPWGEAWGDGTHHGGVVVAAGAQDGEKQPLEEDREGRPGDLRAGPQLVDPEFVGNLLQTRRGQ